MYLGKDIYILLVLLRLGERSDLSRVEGVDRVKWKGGGVGMDPHPQQAGPKIPSRLNVRKQVASLCTL
jgi:hypothetical protein